MKKMITGLVLAAAMVVSAQAQIIISQYYEGASSDKYIEILNISGATIDFSSTNFLLALYSNANREAWKTSGSATSTFTLNTGTLAAGGVLLYKNSSAAAPSYAASAATSAGVINFNGDDSFVLFSGTSAAFANVVDAFGATANSFADTSYARVGGFSGTNADFNASLWQQYSLASVAAASSSSVEYLGFATAAVPEPSTYALLGLGVAGLVFLRRKAAKRVG